MSSVYRIGDLVLDAGRQELTRDGQRIHLGPLSYRFLLTLVETAPDVANHDALAAAVWRGRVVSPETISQRGKLLREALGDDPHHPRYVEVLRGRGYRLVPPVVPLPSGKRPARFRRPVIAVAASLVLGVAAVLWRLGAPESAAPAIPSIAVLPFADMSAAGNQQYLADGIAEEILNLLSGTTSLKVIARTSSFSFKDESADIATIAEKLNVSHLIEGSVRRSGDRVRVSVQLIGASDGTHLWSESYDRDVRDILQLQHEIAASIAAALEVELLGRDSPVPAVTRLNPAAFDAYLRGRQQMQMQRYAEAETYLEQALDLDPEFLPAYSNLGLVYVLEILDVRAPLAENLEKLRRIVQQGLAIAPDDPSLIGLSGQLARYDGDMELAEQRLGRAFAGDPSNVPIVLLYAMFKLDQGYPREALQVALRLLRRDPLNSLLHILVWGCHMDLGKASEAMVAAMRFNEVVGVPSPVGFELRGWTRAVLEGDLVGSVRDDERAEAIGTDGAQRAYAWPPLYYDLLDMATGDAALAQHSPPEGMIFPTAYGYLARGDVARARELALLAVSPRRQGWSASYDDPAKVRLATDALIASGDARRAVELIERLAPVYAGYRLRRHLDAGEFSPAPYAVKGTSSTYPALYFPDYVRALRAAGDSSGAQNMLRHLEAILRLRRERRLFVEERHVAEARALRGDLEGALDALEQAERDRTIYVLWHLYLRHNEIFADIRDHPRFKALVSRVEEEMRRQGAELARATPAR